MVDLQEVDNAVNQARKEVSQRYDFKGSKAAIDFDRTEGTLTLTADDEFKLQALWEVLETRMVRRKVPLKNLKRGEVEHGANDTVRRVITLQQGVPIEAGREIVKFLKDRKLRKVQPAIQGDQLRISSPSRDELQSVMALLRGRISASSCSLGTIGSRRTAHALRLTLQAYARLTLALTLAARAVARVPGTQIARSPSQDAIVSRSPWPPPRHGSRRALHLLGADGGDPLLVLQRALHQQKRLLEDHQAPLGEQIGADDDVGDAGFVLDRQENEPLGGARSLAGDHGARDAHAAAVSLAGEIGRPQRAAQAHLLAAQGHRVRPDGEAGALVIGDDTLGGAHLGQRTRFIVRSCDPAILRSGAIARRSVAEAHDRTIARSRDLTIARCCPFRIQFPCGPDGSFDLPERLPPGVAEGVERADLGQHRQFFTIDPGAGDEILNRAEAIGIGRATL